MLRLAGLGAIFGVFSLPSYLIGWATPHTTAGLGLVAVMEPMRAAVRRAFSRARASLNDLVFQQRCGQSSLLTHFELEGARIADQAGFVTPTA